MADKVYRVGAYVRLSVDSASIDSDSIENQSDMLSKFIDMMAGWVQVKIYVDNGFSGATFQRPAFQEMIQDAVQGKINLVLVKDLSRFGRNYLEAGKYLEDVLPSLGCRFVAIHDGIDTEDGENDIMPFLNAMNDYYVKSHSDRIRSVLAAKASAGQKVSGHAPYGYRRSEADNSQLIVDEYSAEIVRRIFEMRKQGIGSSIIAQALNAESVLPPRLYYKTNVGKHSHKTKTKCWRPSSILRILRSEIYIGNGIQLKRKIHSYRDRRLVMRPEDEWIRMDGIFPAIIDIETWDSVQRVNKANSRRIVKSNDVALFSGFAYCLDCGSKLAYNKCKSHYRSRVTGEITKDTYHPAYTCRHYRNTARAECSVHNISEKNLSNVVFQQIKMLIDSVRIDKDAVTASLTERLIGEQKVSLAERKKEVLLLRKRIKKLETAIASLYESYAIGQSSNDSFSVSIRQYEAKRLDYENRLVSLEASEQGSEAMADNIHKLTHLAQEHLNVTEINRSLLETFVEKIEIGEAVFTDGFKEQKIIIYYKFIGCPL